MFVFLYCLFFYIWISWLTLVMSCGVKEQKITSQYTEILFISCRNWINRKDKKMTPRCFGIISLVDLFFMSDSLKFKLTNF